MVGQVGAVPARFGLGGPGTARPSRPFVISLCYVFFYRLKYYYYFIDLYIIISIFIIIKTIILSTKVASAVRLQHIALPRARAGGIIYWIVVPSRRSNRRVIAPIQ